MLDRVPQALMYLTGYIQSDNKVWTDMIIASAQAWHGKISMSKAEHMSTGLLTVSNISFLVNLQENIL